MTQTNKNIFYLLMLLAMAGWGASWVNAIVLSSYINEYELIFLRNFFTIITLAPVLIINKHYFKIYLSTDSQYKPLFFMDVKTIHRAALHKAEQRRTSRKSRASQRQTAKSATVQSRPVSQKRYTLKIYIQ